MPDSEILRSRLRDGVLRLQLNRPGKRNAMNAALANAIYEGMQRGDDDADVRVIVIEGSGGSFSAGADMTEALAAFESGDQRFNPVSRASQRVAASPKPVIAAIDGPAYGGGALLATATDIRILTRRSAFRFPGAEYGLVVGGTALPRLVGNARAKEILFSARVVEAEEAVAIGLANAVVDDAGALADHVGELAATIAAASPGAVAWMKRIVDAATSGGQAHLLETQADMALRGSPDHLARFRGATSRVTGRRAARPPTGAPRSDGHDG